MKIRSLIDENGDRTTFAIHADTPDERELVEDLISNLYKELQRLTGCTIKDRYRKHRHTTRQEREATKASRERKEHELRNTRGKW